MTLEQLQNVTLERYFFESLFSLVNVASVPEGESSFSLSDGEGSMYDRLQLHSSLVKPSLEEMQAAFEIYKAQMIAEKQAELAEKSRIENIKERLSAFDSDPSIPFMRLGLLAQHPNWAIQHKEIIEQNKIDLLESLETEWDTYQAELSYIASQSTIERLRSERNVKLIESDWTQLADAPLTSDEKAEYRNYRKYLRALPAIWEGQHISEPICLTFEAWKQNPPVYPEGI